MYMLKVSKHIAKGEMAMPRAVLKRSHMHTSSRANWKTVGGCVLAFLCFALFQIYMHESKF